jgi:predicted SPOUT superfamily RNA methylase MTH1
MPALENGSLRIFLPADFLQNISTLEQKTLLLGDLSRYCCIYNVNEICFYDIPDAWKEKGFEREMIEDILTYQMTPQYIRKYLFQKRKTLAAVGLLHPLNTLNHPTEKEPLEMQLKEGNVVYRQGFRLKKVGSTAVIDIGLQTFVEVNEKSNARKEGLVNVRITKESGKIKVQYVEKHEIPLYWGYETRFLDDPFQKIIQDVKHSDICIATSKSGQNYKELIRDRVPFRSENRKNVSIFFGPRTAGLKQFFDTPDLFFKSFDHVINCFSHPGTKSIRLEEAIPITLGIVELINDLEERK